MAAASIPADFPADVLRQLRARQPQLWINPGLAPTASPPPELDAAPAQARMARCAGLLAHVFPELAASEGRVTSPLQPVPSFQDYASATPGRWLIKCDHALPVAGSVKARGGFHEVLAYAEALALAEGIIGPDDDRRALASPEARACFARHTVAVGSTGNLGLGIGMISAALGFKAVVHMSADAKDWKKDRLRSRGITVVEHDGDYAQAVEAGRQLADRDDTIYFVDDERSLPLFLGYTAAALELADQLADLNIPVDATHPLFVYLPCGVGGAPGGIAYGLKQHFGEHVHCFFAEPVAAPCMLVQLASGGDEPLSVYDVGLDNRTEADGLAVGLASPLVAPLMRTMLSGVFTIDDDALFRWAYRLKHTEDVLVEPSAAAGFSGPDWLASPQAQPYLAAHGLAPHMAQATHVLWSTGGSLVPPEEHARFQARGQQLDNAA
jgi:D-serine dehydratase